MNLKKNIKDNLSDRALQEIRENILSLHFTPGDRIIIDRLADQLSISRTPIREALKELVNEGLVQYDKISYRVVSLAEKDIRNIFSIRKALEILATGETARNCNTDIQKEFLLIYKKSCMLKKNFLYYEAMNQKFHLFIAENTDNPRLLNLLSSYQNFNRLVLRWTYSVTLTEADVIKTNMEHKSIIDGIISNNINDAREAMAAHLENAEKRTIAAIKQANKK